MIVITLLCLAHIERHSGCELCIEINKIYIIQIALFCDVSWNVSTWLPLGLNSRLMKIAASVI